MLLARRLTLSVVATIAMTAGIFAAPIAQPVAQAASPHRAAVIVDTGAGVHRVVITFTEDSITGIDALQRANADPVIYSFNGQGGAVCRLFGVGRDAGPNCLGGQDGDARYWAYFRAPAGTSTFKYSSVGAGTARVHDGDVEGWKFGTGAAPEFVSLDSLAPPPPPPTNPPAQTSVTPAGPGGAAATPPTSGPAKSGAAAASGATASASTLPVTGASDAGASGATGPDASKSALATTGGDSNKKSGKLKQEDTSAAALAGSSSDDGGSSATSLIWFGALIAAIAVAIVVARRIRRRAGQPS